MPNARKVFISYSWDDDSHREWVRNFAIRLRKDGIDVTLDRWDAVPGDQLPSFMEKAVKQSKKVLCICTPNYKKKSDLRAGGAGYEGDIMTGQVFVGGDQRKFIPILRKSDWKKAAPSWLLGRYYIDLRGDPYSQENYAELLATLRDEREKAPPVGGEQPSVPEDDIEFVNRKRELEMLDLAKPQDSYNQWFLVSSPTGSGKSRLLKRLIYNIQRDVELSKRWNYCYVDLKECKESDRANKYFAQKVMDRSVPSSWGDEKLKDHVCAHILDKMSGSLDDGSLGCVLLMLDSIDVLTLKTREWFYAVIQKVIVNSYVNYETGAISFSLRIILSGVDTESFWNGYKVWQDRSNISHRLKAPNKLSLSAFDDAAVQELISRRMEKSRISVQQSLIPSISNELLYLSGGHPAVINGFLGELIETKFRLYQDYIKSNRERLVKKYISRIVRKILDRFKDQPTRKDIKTACVFRLIDLDILRKLSLEGLISKETKVEDLLHLLIANRILQAPNKDTPFYHDDVIRRILYLDFAFGDAKDSRHVQRVHSFAQKIYRNLIEIKDEHILNYFFVEWLFHTLQIASLSNDAIVSDWKSMLSKTKLVDFLPEHFRSTVKKILENDREIKYLYHDRFGSEDMSPLFDF